MGRGKIQWGGTKKDQHIFYYQGPKDARCSTGFWSKVSVGIREFFDFALFRLYKKNFETTPFQ